MKETIGYTLLGRRGHGVIVMHDWFSDCSSYKELYPLLDNPAFQFAFMDLRGYGRSRAILGECSVEEASYDALALAQKLGWEQFHLIGHSMSGLIAQNIAATAPERVKSLIAITPVPAQGSMAPEDMIGFLQDAATTNEESAFQIINFITGMRHSKSFLSSKVQQWRDTSAPEARLAYLEMFTQTNIADKTRGLNTPILVITGQHDNPQYQEAELRDAFCSLYPNVTFAIIQEAGHYPMQEAPAALASLINAFLEAQEQSGAA